MTVVTVTNIVYKEPTDAPTEFVFGFDEEVDHAYIEAEMKSHIEEQAQQLVESFEYSFTASE